MMASEGASAAVRPGVTTGTSGSQISVISGFISIGCFVCADTLKAMADKVNAKMLIFSSGKLF